LKRLVAYSSIAYAIVVLGLFSNTIVGIEGAIRLSIAHGFISPAMFVLVGGVLYDRVHTRIIRYYRGTVYMPVFGLLFFLATIANMGIPLSLIGQVNTCHYLECSNNHLYCIIRINRNFIICML
jgi:NADH-ubiquinone oxidoreductase chain 4